MKDKKKKNRLWSGDFKLKVVLDIIDQYPKYVLSMDKINFSKEGIIHKNIIDFLLE